MDIGIEIRMTIVMKIGMVNEIAWPPTDQLKLGQVQLSSSPGARCGNRNFSIYL